MTEATRRRLADHFRSIGREDHPHCKEFPVKEDKPIKAKKKRR